MVKATIKVHCCVVAEDSLYSKGMQAEWVKGTGIQVVEQKVAQLEVEGVPERSVGEELKEVEEDEEEELGFQCDGPVVGSSLEVGWG